MLVCAVPASPAGAAAASCCLGFDRPGQVVAAPDSEHVYVADPYVTLALRLEPASGTLAQIDSYDGGGELMEMSRDGRLLYQAATWPPTYRGINVWRRDDATGALSVVGSWRASSPGKFEDIALAPDGRQLYVTDSERDALAILDADPDSGRLAYRSELRNGRDGVSGLGYPGGIAVTPDGAWVYVAQRQGSPSTVGFDRSADGALAHEPAVTCECPFGGTLALSPDTSWLIKGPVGPYAIRRNTSTGELTRVSTVIVSNSGSEDLVDGIVAFAPNGGGFYTIDRAQHRLFEFALGRGGPALVRTYGEEVPGVHDARSLTVTADGRFVLVAGSSPPSDPAQSAGSVTVLRRDPASGALSYGSTFRGSARADGGGDAPGSARPRPARLTIDGGAEFTNDPRVTLTLDADPSVTSVEISNDSAFAASTTIARDARDRYAWRLRSTGPERVPKTVYVRTIGGGGQIVSDDIVLDERAPQIVALALVPSKRGARGARTVRLRIRAHDRVSGVAAMQVTANRRRPGPWKSFAATSAVRVGGPLLWVRVRDSAGNPSRWKALRVKR